MPLSAKRVCLYGLLLCAVGRSIDLDLVDANLGKPLTVSLQLLVLLLPLVVEDQDLVAASITQNRGNHFSRLGLRHRTRIAGKCQHIAEFDGAVIIRSRPLNLHHVARSDTILLTTCADHRVHKSSSASTRGA